VTNIYYNTSEDEQRRMSRSGEKSNVAKKKVDGAPKVVLNQN